MTDTPNDADQAEKTIADEAITAGLINLLEVKLNAFMGRADLSSSPPEDKVAIRAAYFLGVSAGMSVSKHLIDNEAEQASSKSSTDES